MKRKRVVVLGGYGNFGKRICENLSLEPSLTLIIAGRNADKMAALQRQLLLECAASDIETAVIDIQAEDFEVQLELLNPDVVIHTAGPFQGQAYIVPRACIKAGSHYIDLADDRRYVCDIGVLDKEAKDNNLLLVAGASSVPGLSSAVVGQYASEFQYLNSIDVAIAPGNRSERGLATLKAVLSYTGHALSVFIGGRWTRQYGWMSARRWGFGDVIGQRWLANVDVPDLEIFPAHFNVRDHVRFQAGLELLPLHFAMVAMAQLSKWGLVKDWSRYANFIFRLSHRFDGLGSDAGGMRIELQGVGLHGDPKKVNWVLSATDGVGPYIPTLAAIIVAKKFISNELTETGATACVGLFSLREFEQEAQPLGIVSGLEPDCG